jgi:C-terminal processing protease CtpA/Prc
MNPLRPFASFAALALALTLAGCGGGSGGEPASPPQTDSCSVEAQRASLRTFMQEEYLWYDHLGTPDPAAETMDAYFQSLLNKPQDHYSYTQSAAAFNQVFTEGRRTGYGYTLAWEDEAHTRLRIRNVEPRSPVALAGLRRGDTVLSIDGWPPEDVAAGKLATVTTEGVPRDFIVRGVDGSTRRLQVVSADFPLTPVTHSAVFEVTRADGSPAKVGYLAYNQFVLYSQVDFSDAFRRFAEAGVDELVFDLRYNGGGSVAVAQRLASLVGAKAAETQIFADLKYNPQMRLSNRAYRFLPADSRILLTRPLEGLKRLVVIASGSTASASELVVNGLRPFMPVVLVGTRSYGKPYGSVPRTACGIVYNAMQFQSLNAVGVADYASGFAPDCEVADDLDHELGDTRERRLATALAYVREGRCPAPPQSAALASKRAAEPAPLGETVPPALFAD